MVFAGIDDWGYLPLPSAPWYGYPPEPLGSCWEDVPKSLFQSKGCRRVSHSFTKLHALPAPGTGPTLSLHAWCFPRWSCTAGYLPSCSCSSLPEPQCSASFLFLHTCYDVFLELVVFLLEFCFVDVGLKWELANPSSLYLPPWCPPVPFVWGVILLSQPWISWHS